MEVSSELEYAHDRKAVHRVCARSASYAAIQIHTLNWPMNQIRQRRSKIFRPAPDGQRMPASPANMAVKPPQPAFFLASRNHVSTTVSGFSDTDSMPCSISHSARSG